jgi:hypothetical protein
MLDASYGFTLGKIRQMMDHCSGETLAEEPEDVDVDIQTPTIPGWSTLTNWEEGKVRYGNLLLVGCKQPGWVVDSRQREGLKEGSTGLLSLSVYIYHTIGQVCVTQSDL